MVRVLASEGACVRVYLLAAATLLVSTRAYQLVWNVDNSAGINTPGTVRGQTDHSCPALHVRFPVSV